MWRPVLLRNHRTSQLNQDIHPMSAATRRHRGQQLEAEDATDLTLGDDFKDAIVLSLGEANVLLDKVLNPDDPDAKTEREALPENPCVVFSDSVLPSSTPERN